MGPGSVQVALSELMWYKKESDAPTDSPHFTLLVLLWSWLWLVEERKPQGTGFCKYELPQVYFRGKMCVELPHLSSHFLGPMHIHLSLFFFSVTVHLVRWKEPSLCILVE